MSVDFTSSVDNETPLAADVRQTFRRLVFWAAWLLLAIPVPAFLIGLDLPQLLQALPLAISAVLLGMPHGAVDHLVLPRLQDRRPSWRSISVIVALYVLLSGAYLAWWFFAPAQAAIFFILLTWFHWGQGELFPLMAFTDADHLASRIQRALTIVARGGLPMLVPLLGFPEAYRSFLNVLIRPFSTPGGSELAWLFQPSVRLTLGLSFAAVTVVMLLHGYLHSQHWAAWAIDGFETVFLWVFFLTVPPVFAIGLYFCFWHSARHVARLIAVDTPARRAIRQQDLTTALLRFVKDAAPTTAGALVLFYALLVVVPNQPDTLLQYSGLYLVLIAILTLPHVVVVTMMDRYQGIW